MFSLAERWRLAILQILVRRGHYRDDTSSPERNRLLFHRWLYVTGRLSDTPATVPARDEPPARDE